jgi:hypothetical protein
VHSKKGRPGWPVVLFYLIFSFCDDLCLVKKYNYGVMAKMAVAGNPFTVTLASAIAEALYASCMGIVAVNDGGPAGKTAHKFSKAPFIALMVATADFFLLFFCDFLHCFSM